MSNIMKFVEIACLVVAVFNFLTGNCLEAILFMILKISMQQDRNEL